MYEIYAGISGNTHGLTNVKMPATKLTKKGAELKNPLNASSI
jgi:hypothetical protein